MTKSLPELTAELKTAMVEFNDGLAGVGVRPCHHYAMTSVGRDDSGVIPYIWYRCERCGEEFGIAEPSLIAFVMPQTILAQERDGTLEFPVRRR